MKKGDGTMNKKHIENGWKYSIKNGAESIIGFPVTTSQKLSVAKTINRYL